MHPLHHKAGLLLRGVVLRGPLLVFQEAVLYRRNLGRGIDPKLFRIDLVERRMILHLGVSPGLRHGRIVDFGVPMPPVSDQVHHHIRPERLAVVRRDLGHPNHRVHILRVDMEDRDREPLRQIRRKARAVRLLRDWP